MHDAIDQVLIRMRGMWRYRWIAVAAIWLVAVGGWVFVHNMPDKFEASARVYIDSDSVLRPLLKGLAVETDVEQQLKLMTKTLLSRPNIEKIIRMTDMDIKAITPDQKMLMISRLSQSIKINKLARERDVNLYQINYMNSDRVLAKAVVQSLLNILLENSLGDKREDTDSARVFIEEQIKDYEARLVAAEDRLTRFKQSNVGVLPGQEGGYYQRLEAQKQLREQALLELREALDRRDTVQQQIKELTDNGKLSSAGGRELSSPEESRILILQTKLDEMLLQYTDQHPSVRELKQKIEALQRQQDENTAIDVKNGSGWLNNSKMYQELKLVEAGEEANVAALKSRVAEYRKRIQRLQTQIGTMPEIEAELKKLDRDYMINKNNYDSLITRRESANLASRAEEAGDTIQFKIIDPPWVPYSASEPKRLLLSSLALVLAIGGGLGLVFLITEINPMIYDRKVLQELTGVPVWGGVSLVLTDVEQISGRRETVLFIATLALLIVAYGLVMIYEMQKSGMLSGLSKLTGG